MIRATTPIHTFIFEEDPSGYARILITYAQGGSIVMEKTKSDLDFETVNDPLTNKLYYTASYRLSQEETKKFQASSGKQVQVQVRVLTNSGEALASDKKSISVQDVLNDEVLV